MKIEKSIIELEKIEKLRDHFNATSNKIEQNIEKKVEIHQKLKKNSKNQIKKDNKIEESLWNNIVPYFKKKVKWNSIFHLGSICLLESNFLLKSEFRESKLFSDVW